MINVVIGEAKIKMQYAKMVLNTEKEFDSILYILVELVVFCLKINVFLIILTVNKYNPIKNIT